MTIKDLLNVCAKNAKSINMAAHCLYRIPLFTIWAKVKQSAQFITTFSCINFNLKLNAFRSKQFLNIVDQFFRRPVKEYSIG